ncbi:MAG: hypothetical protein ING66_03865 [Rhodocyclaceae bacterium]|jgi:hypothetical protein|nr:hypothetical protein [Rhodocyclaceae bacterium]MCA3061785.1 hypothetical protein [Rhodocyclaceae bacterium]
MEQSQFEFDEDDRAQLVRARKARLRPASKLLLYVDRIQQLGMQKYFSYSAIAEKLVQEGGPKVHRLALRRFVERNLPDVFAFRSNFEFNRSHPQSAKENTHEEK